MNFLYFAFSRLQHTHQHENKNLKKKIDKFSKIYLRHFYISTFSIFVFIFTTKNQQKLKKILGLVTFKQNNKRQESCQKSSEMKVLI